MMTKNEAFKQLDGAEMVLLNRDFKSFNQAILMAMDALLDQKRLSDKVKTLAEELEEKGCRLAYYEDLEEQGRLITLPCKVGDTVYSTLDDLGRLHKCEVRGVYKGRREHESYVELEPVSYRGRNYGAAFGAFGKTVFLTRELAEEALGGAE